MSDMLRFCPVCGMPTAEALCPSDKVATFTLAKSSGEAPRFGTGDVVAGKYRITKKLGQGGFGAVYEADHTGGLGRVAVKMLTLVDQDADDVRRFYREAQVTAQLRHANTVRVFDVGQVEGGSLFIAMELLNGRSLEDALKDGLAKGQVFSQAEAIAMASDVLKSLSEAHGNGLVHRDLKPANLMMTEVDGEQVVKVLDFGIAHVQDSSLTGTGRALGTPAYMSPEQCSGVALDARSDLYALGVILFRCVAGKPPFSDPNPLALMFAHAAQPPPDLFSMARTAVGEPFVACVMRALAKNPAERFASAKEMRLALLEAGKAPLVEMPLHAAETGDYGVRHVPTPADLGDRVRRATGLSPRLVVTSTLEQLPADATGGLTLDARPLTLPATPPAVPVVGAALPALTAAATADSAVPTPVVAAAGAPKWPLVVGAALAVAAAIVVAVTLGKGNAPAPARPTEVAAAPESAPTPRIASPIAAPPPAPVVAIALPSASTPAAVAAQPAPAAPALAPAVAAVAPEPAAAKLPNPKPVPASVDESAVKKAKPKSDKAKAAGGKPGKIDSSLPDD